MAKWEFPEGRPKELFEDIDALAPEAKRLIKDQHVVSKVVLKGFAEKTGKNSELQLTPFDLNLGREKRSRGTDGCGKIDHFLLYASESAELLWKRVEDHASEAITAARAGGILQDDRLVSNIKDLIALHFVRSPRSLLVHNESVSRTYHSVRQEVLKTKSDLLRQEFRRRYGLEPAGPQALELVLDDSMSRWQELSKQGAIARASMENMFRRVRATFQASALEVFHAPNDREFLISDSPAFTYRYKNNNGVIEPNLAIGDSHGVAMPIAHDCLVGIGASPREEEFSISNVRLFNELQVIVGFDYVYYRPGSGLRTFVESVNSRMP